jgi:hypothetical protein
MLQPVKTLCRVVLRSKLSIDKSRSSTRLLPRAHSLCWRGSSALQCSGIRNPRLSELFPNGCNPEGVTHYRHRDRIPQIGATPRSDLIFRSGVGHHAYRRHFNNSCHISSQHPHHSLLPERFSTGTEWVLCLCQSAIFLKSRDHLLFCTAFSKQRRLGNGTFSTPQRWMQLAG